MDLISNVVIQRYSCWNAIVKSGEISNEYSENISDYNNGGVWYGYFWTFKTSAQRLKSYFAQIHENIFVPPKVFEEHVQSLKKFIY